MRLESWIGGCGWMVAGDETGQILVLRDDGNLWLSRRTILSVQPHDERYIESVHRLIPAEAASEILDAVDRYACALDTPPYDIEPWRLDIAYDSDPTKVIFGCLDSHVPDLGCTLSEFIRRKLATVPDDPNADHGIGKPFLTMLDVSKMLLFDQGRLERKNSSEGSEPLLSATDDDEFMEEYDETKPTIYEVVRAMDRDSKDAMSMLESSWERSCYPSYMDAAHDGEDDDFGDPASYAVTERYFRPDGCMAKVYYADEDEKSISEIRFWIETGPEEKEKVISAYEEAHPGEEADPSLVSDLYKSYLYRKAMGEHRRRLRLSRTPRIGNTSEKGDHESPGTRTMTKDPSWFQKPSAAITATIAIAYRRSPMNRSLVYIDLRLPRGGWRFSNLESPRHCLSTL